MATIKTPVTGVSPYQEAAAAPIMLRADANGNTVLANPTVTATAADTAITAAANADSNVIVNGQAALNQLIASSRTGVFEGANVTINLEEQLFNTTNQVTSTTNYAEGANGSIQYNNGSNGFSGDPYFTYTSGNVVTPGIRTDGYFYSNGAPFISGGNAAIGNFVFNGDVMTIAHANSTLSVAGNTLGAVEISTADGQATWTFDANGVLTVYGIINAVDGNDLQLTTTSGGEIDINSSTGVYVVANTSLWQFNADSTTTFPDNTLKIANDQPLTTRTQSSGNAYAIAYQSPNSWEAYAEDDTTGPHNAYAWIKADLVTANTPRVFITNAKSSDGVELTWTFGPDGSTTFPTLTVDLHNGGNQSGQTLQFGDPNQQAFITGPAPAANVAAQRLIIQGQRGLGTGEGGDVYVWGGDSEINGGDIKIYAGDADNGSSGQGGNIHISGGTGQNPGGEISLTGGTTYNGQGAPIVVTGGRGSTAGGNINLRGGYGDLTGGPISLVAGYGGDGAGGNVDITGGQSAGGLSYYGNVNINAGASSWHFENTGNLTLPSNIASINYANGQPYGGTGGANTGNVTFNNINVIGTGNLKLQPDANNAGAYLDIYLTTGPDIHIAGNGENVIVGGDSAANITVNTTGAVSIQSYDAGNSQSHIWNFDTTGNLTTPGVSGDITGANLIGTVSLSAAGNVFGNYLGANIDINAFGNVVANSALMDYLVSSANLQVSGTANVGNLSTVGSVSANGNITTLSAMYSGNGATWQSQVALANVLFVGADVGEAYVQAAMVNTSGNGSSDWVSYANNGNTDQAWIDMGFTGNTFNDPAYTVTAPNDGYIFVQGNTSFGGNLILATGNTGTTKDIVFATGGFETGNVKARLYNSTGEFSVVGNVAANYFIGNGSQLTGVGAASVPSQNILPTIQTIAISNTSAQYQLGGGSGSANVTVANIIPVIEYGVIITSGTSSQKYAIGNLANIPGTEQLTFTTAQSDTQFTVYGYVTSNAGTYYSNSATGYSGLCLMAGTQIALSDGSYKAIEDITYTDKMLSWDFDRGCYAETKALWIKRSETGSQYNLLTFSDGTTLRTVDQHRIFNKQVGAFTYPMTAATPIGTITVNEHGQEITLINKQVIQDTIEYYNVITNYHMNLFSDSVLTSCRFNNIYPITDMKFVKDSRTLRTRAEFENVEDRFFHGLRLAEQTTDIETVEWYVNRLLATEMSTQVELAG